MVLEVESKGLFQKSKADVILSHSMEDETDVGVDEGQLGVILPGNHEGEVPCSVKELESCGYLNKMWVMGLLGMERLEKPLRVQLQLCTNK